ncbi:ComEC/Rec2 family competence protein [Bradyrhizobium liaoningense]|uniref:ComEC/Rec2 family competence protein n=1 Tax=Bradyrhizobium liaoningense TaxID=43992 RepID=UPI001BA7F52A|nr:MBL fold metallo-hydrolase [Bradyrhizobium liaoningense]MBR1170195.1 MBL fold metallo-hydrolase [Bradyrhizobium liaoningense]
MADFFELDFLDVETKSSGDAICIRYELNGETYIHVVDGGYQSTYDKIAGHLKNHYGAPSFINHVVATHNDGDHTGGLQEVLENYDVGCFWMLGPWNYADELLPRFKNYTSADNLRKKLRSVYSNLAMLEDIAKKRGITICEPFQSAQIGAFRVMAPTKQRFLDLVASSEKTPEETGLSEVLTAAAKRTFVKVANLVKAVWGAEYFPPEDTSSENEMSVAQYAYLCGRKILLTGDTGRGGLNEIIFYAPAVGLTLPGIDRFQVPHHGGRHNVNTELLDKLLGPRLDQQPSSGIFTAVISSAKEDEDHPRKSVVRAMIHRGAKVVTTEGRSIVSYGGESNGHGWGKATPVDYPDEQED